MEGVEAYGKIDAARCEHVVHAEIHLNDENKAELKFEVLEVKALQNMKERTKIAASKMVRTTDASGCPTRWMRRVYFLAEASASSSLFAPNADYTMRFEEHCPHL